MSRRLHAVPRPIFRTWALGLVAALALAPVVLMAQPAAATGQPVAKAAAPVAEPQGRLESVSCISTSDCVAVGNTDPDENGVAIAERWNGTDWTSFAVPGAYVALDAVSCVSASFCMAVGYQGACPLAESLDGTTWTEVTADNRLTCQPGGLDISMLFGVSCTSPTACVAVGANQQGATGNYVSPIVGVWDGKSWSFQVPPVPPDTVGSSLSGVDCPSLSNCVAVGYDESDPDGIDQEQLEPLAESWNGARWAVATGPDEQNAWLSGVSCTSTSSCVAVGGADTYTGNFSDGWNGTSLVAMDQPGGGAGLSYLNGVSCSSPNACLAVGVADSSWNGSTWSTTQPASPRSDIPYSAWCASSTWCVAVGEDLVAYWNGTEWLPSPPAPVVAIVATPDGKGYSWPPPTAPSAPRGTRSSTGTWRASP